MTAQVEFLMVIINRPRKKLQFRLWHILSFDLWNSYLDVNQKYNINWHYIIGEIV